MQQLTDNKGRFTKGMTPWNKGVTMRLSPKTEFKKGQPSWNKGLKFPKEQHWNWQGGDLRPGFKCPTCGGKKSAKTAYQCFACGRTALQERMRKVQPLAVKKMADKMAKDGFYHSAKSRKLMSEYRVNHPEMQTHDTVIEQIVEKLLVDSRIIYEKQTPLCNVTIADFYLPTFNVALFCDGCYWHGCPIHPSIQKAVGLNYYQNKTLRKNGITVLRLWEHDIKKNPQDCLDKLFAIINLTN